MARYGASTAGETKTAVLTQNGVSVYDGAKLFGLAEKLRGAEEALLTDSGDHRRGEAAAHG